jgi:arylsulfatase A
MSRDDTEKVNVEKEHPEIVRRLVALIERYVNDGRSTAGVPQKNDVRVNIRNPEAWEGASDNAAPQSFDSDRKKRP